MIVLEKGSWLPEVYQRLLSFIEDAGLQKSVYGACPVAVFDFDNTCIKGDIGYSFFYRMVEEGTFHYWFEPFRKFFLSFDPTTRSKQVIELLSAGARGDSDRGRLRILMRDIMRSIRTEMGEGKVFEWMAGLLLGWSYQDIKDKTRRVFIEELNSPLKEKVIAEWRGEKWIVSSGIRIYEEIKNLIETLQKVGFAVWIISATAQVIVEVAAEFLGVTPHYCIGIRHRIENGCLVATEGGVTYREGKVKAVDLIIGRRPVFVAGDWFTDLELLDYSEGISLLIDRGNRDLAEYAIKRGWLIQPAFKI